MRVLLDTNVVVAGLLWNGHPRTLLNFAIDGKIALIASANLLSELTHTLNYPKFTKRIAEHGASVASLTTHYAALIHLIKPDFVPRIILKDADDDHVLACAVAGNAALIISGDKHLHSLGGAYQSMPIVTPAEAIEIVENYETSQRSLGL